MVPREHLRAKKVTDTDNYVNIFEANHAVLLLIDPVSGEIVDANPAACRFYGYAREEMTRLKIYEINMLGQDRMFQKMDQAKSGSQGHFYFKHRLADGQLRDVEVYSGRVYVRGRQLLYSIVHDITKLKKAEAAVKTAYTELNQIFNSAPDCMWVVALDYKVLRANQTMLKLLGIKKQEVIGKKCRDICACPYCGSEQCPIEKIKNGANRVEYESENRLRDGRKLPFIVTSTPYYNVRGELIGIIQNLKDLSERGRFNFFDSQNQGNYAKHLKIKNLLKKAIDNNELIPFYQPQVDIMTGRIIGLEALLRWNNPEYGMLLPGQFIPICEESGLILPIGRWLLKSVCAQNAAWQKKGTGPFVVSVNVSPRQILYDDLVSVIEQALDETGLAPEYLGLEITESIAFGDFDQAIVRLKKIKELGVKIYLDDFGVGFSALSCLTKFPVDCIKIDKTFIENLVNDDGSKAVARAIIDLAHSLKLQVIAEGVEKIEQLDFLKQKNCDAVQGFLYSRPLPAEAIEKFVKQDTWLRLI